MTNSLPRRSIKKQMKNGDWSWTVRKCWRGEKEVKCRRKPKTRKTKRRPSLSSRSNGFFCTIGSNGKKRKCKLSDVLKLFRN